MSEGEGASGGRVGVGLGGIVLYVKPAPSLAIVKFWQGIVEVATRVAILVGLLVLFIACSVAQNEAAGLGSNPNINRARAGAGWTTFLGVVGFFYGVTFLLLRFLNPGFMTAFRMIVLVEDAIFNGVLAVLIMTGAASLAAGSGYLTSALNASSEFDNIIRSVRNALGAAAFFAFVMMFMYIFLTVWMILYIVFKWDTKSGGSGEKPTAAPV